MATRDVPLGSGPPVAQHQPARVRGVRDEIAGEGADEARQRERLAAVHAVPEGFRGVVVLDRQHVIAVDEDLRREVATLGHRDWRATGVSGPVTGPTKICVV